MKVKKQQVRANHVECHQKFQARIHEAEDSMQAQHLIIEALVDEKDSLLQTIHGLQEANNAPAPFDGECAPDERGREERDACGRRTPEIRQSGPRPDSRLLRQTALEVLTRSARSDSPRKTRPERNSGEVGRRRQRTAGGGGGGGVVERGV
ncbi:hypothetical protein F511_33938 [Dorcoceras hygrometricum]|uniref:Uncharacterized protein n=1 Tax=Dorcoceras hygrometricum TaxID=472368 RepID=A0A2Z7CMS2_9LAMI|nr:hypothetical protein F511_33938 [Dorcoceras hygrometricum]